MKVPNRIKIDIRCDTEVDGKRIIQRITLPSILQTDPHDGHELATRVCDTAEKGIREALIKLGWTPPKDEPTT
ncbi:MAG: hypothetical protein IMF11_13725 [Proteobacteria bacterium]|nr:hypothetical protein [Pseudomonadota bacterium]